MAIRGKPALQKRQKEAARRDKQLRKAARRAQRKLDNADGGRGSNEERFIEIDPSAEPPEI